MFSERERKIVKILGQRKMTIWDITKKLFHPQVGRPVDPNVAVGNSINRINKKCEYHKLDWRLNKIRTDGKMFIKKEKV